MCVFKLFHEYMLNLSTKFQILTPSTQKKNIILTFLRNQLILSLSKFIKYTNIYDAKKHDSWNIFFINKHI